MLCGHTPTTDVSDGTCCICTILWVGFFVSSFWKTWFLRFICVFMCVFIVFSSEIVVLSPQFPGELLLGARRQWTRVPAWPHEAWRKLRTGATTGDWDGTWMDWGRLGWLGWWWIFWTSNFVLHARNIRNLVPPESKIMVESTNSMFLRG